MRRERLVSVGLKIVDPPNLLIFILLSTKGEITKMKIGTKSLLFGMHMWFWHPIMVLRAWWFLYGRPNWKEVVCIFIHDWGYWGKPNLDGPEGIEHPELGANLAFKLFRDPYWEFCAGHSRSYISLVNDRFGHAMYKVSKLCWADKLSFTFEPRWFYLWRARLSGELQIARDDFPRVPPHCSDEEWFDAACDYFINEVIAALADDPTYPGRTKKQLSILSPSLFWHHILKGEEKCSEQNHQRKNKNQNQKYPPIL